MSVDVGTLDFAVVGIGASAAGPGALGRFLENVSSDCGMAFVLVLHLSPTHRRHASEILRRSASLQVTQITASTPIEVDRVDVIPPARDLRMDDHHPHPQQVRAAGRPGGIDLFFRTLAEVHPTRAFGVVLSGTGNDGAVGLGNLNELGGVALARHPEEAEHNGMPLAAIAAGVVDLVLPVSDMPDKLAALWRNARRIRPPELQLAMERGQADRAVTADATETALDDVLAMLRIRTRHEFRRYRRGTVLRRLERRMQVRRDRLIVARGESACG